MLVIYLLAASPLPSIVLPSGSDGPPSLSRLAPNQASPVYMNFQLPECTAPTSLPAWWALTPPSHPHPCGQLFSSALADPCGPLPVRKQDALCCPDFPLLFRAATSRFTEVFEGKDTKVNSKFKIIKFKSHRRMRKQTKAYRKGKDKAQLFEFSIVVSRKIAKFVAN